MTKCFKLQQEYTSCNCHSDGCNEDWKTAGQSSSLEVSLRTAWPIWYKENIVHATAWTGKEVAVTQSQESSQDVDPETRAVSSAKVAIQT